MGAILSAMVAHVPVHQMDLNEPDDENSPDENGEAVHAPETAPPHGRLLWDLDIFKRAHDWNLWLQKLCSMQAISQTSNLQDYPESERQKCTANLFESRTAMLVDIAPLLLTPWLGKHVRDGEPERKWWRDKHWNVTWWNKGPNCKDGPRCLCCQQKKAGLH